MRGVPEEAREGEEIARGGRGGIIANEKVTQGRKENVAEGWKAKEKRGIRTEDNKEGKRGAGDEREKKYILEE